MKTALIVLMLAPIAAIIAYALTVQAAHDDLARGERYP